MDLPHRDDFDFEQVQEWERQAREVYGKGKIVFPGDVPFEDLPDEVKEFVSRMLIIRMVVACEGRCNYCNAEAPNYPGSEDLQALLEDWFLPEDWEVHHDHNENPVAICCPDCALDHP